MKIIFCVALVLFGTFAIIEAYPDIEPAVYQHWQYPSTPTLPEQIRFRRQVFGGQAVSNHNGGVDAKFNLAQGIGTPDHNVVAGVFAAGNTKKGPVTTGGAIEYNFNDHGISLSKDSIHGVRDSLTQSVHANLFNDGANKINLNGFKSQNSLPNGFEFERNGGGLSWSNVNGHGAAASISSIPNFGRQLDLSGKANLWTSADKATRLDLNAGASQWLSGPFSGQRNYGGSLSLGTMFG